MSSRRQYNEVTRFRTLDPASKQFRQTEIMNFLTAAYTLANDRYFRPLFPFEINRATIMLARNDLVKLIFDIFVIG